MSCEPICFANSTPTVTQHVLSLSSLSEEGEVYLFTQEATTLLSQVSFSPELDDHLCLATVAHRPPAPHLWIALKWRVSDLLHVFSLTLTVWMHS